ncbi:DUF4279 domain-containing protein [Pseudoxanthomonas gei]|uniref:DUF4279 domain-containing protein n=1 Tax=Pseudoxanthomonas gei TaxID=1383030 RepID=UPI003CCDFBA4
MPEFFSSSLGRDPRYSWTVGQPRVTRKGAPLPGIYKETYCSYSFDVPEDDDLPRFLDETLTDLAQHKGLFDKIQESGGKAGFFIGLFTGAFNTGFVLSADLQRRSAALGLSLDFDIYGYGGSSDDAA